MMATLDGSRGIGRWRRHRACRRRVVPSASIRKRRGMWAATRTCRRAGLVPSLRPGVARLASSSLL